MVDNEFEWQPKMFDHDERQLNFFGCYLGWLVQIVIENISLPYEDRGFLMHAGC
jgi:hypothetical protein